MLIETLQTIFARDLKRLQTEIESYRDETIIWKVDKSIANSAGNLCLHLIGNLNAYIGAGLAKTGYVRRRDLEFLLKDIQRAELLQQIEATMQVVEAGLKNVSAAQLLQDFPVQIWDKPTGMEYTLVHLTTHLNYHLGQINYHRRLLDN